MNLKEIEKLYIRKRAKGKRLELTGISIENLQIPVLRFSKMEELPGIEHLISTRLGGASSDIWSSMNVSYTRGDDPASVDENFRRIAACFGSSPDRIVCTHQTHTDHVRIVTGKDAGKGVTAERDYSDVDGLVTNEPGIILAAFFADCVPLLFADPVKKVIAVSHSGWRGTAAAIGQKTVNLMENHFGCDPADIYVGIGPSICQACYEVSEDVIEAMKVHFDTDEMREICYPTVPGKYQLDLWETNRRLLLKSGIRSEHLEVTDLCTCCNPDFLFSHRASQGRRGNLGAFMMIK